MKTSAKTNNGRTELLNAVTNETGAFFKAKSAKMNAEKSIIILNNINPFILGFMSFKVFIDSLLTEGKNNTSNAANPEMRSHKKAFQKLEMP